MITVLIFLGAYFALTWALSLAVRPYRVRLMSLASDLCATGQPEDVRDLASRIAFYAYSMRVAPILSLWYTTMLLKPSAEVFREAQEYAHEHPAIMREARFDELFDLYMASTAAINPAFGALAVGLQQLFRLKARAYARRRNTNPQPVLTYVQLQEAA